MIDMGSWFCRLGARHPRLLAFAFGIALIVAACALRAPGMAKQIWNLDEASTFTMAEIVRDGGVLYRDAADNRTPLVPYVKAGLFALVGDWNIRGVHWCLAIILGLTAVWVWRIAAAAGAGNTGRWAAGYFTLLSFVYLTVVDTMTAHTGWFLIFFSGLGMWALVRAWQRDSCLLAGTVGSLFALAALAKQPGMLDLGVGLVIAALGAWHGAKSWRQALRLAGAMAGGFVLILAATWAYFAANHAWDDFLRYAWNYNTQLYVPEVPPMERLWGMRVPFQLAWANSPHILVLGALAAGWLLVRACAGQFRRSDEFPFIEWLILGWTASGLSSTVLSGRDFSHYSIQVLPGLCLAAGWVSVRLWSARQFSFVRWTARAGLVAGLLFLAGKAVHRAATFDTSESMSLDIAAVIQSRTAPDEKIFVWGYEPELYALSHRLPATRFIYAVFLTGMIPWTNVDPLIDTTYAIVPGSWDDFWTDFNRSPPALIVDTRGNRGFVKYPLHREDELWARIQRDYVEVIDDVSKAYGYVIYQRAIAPAAAPAPHPTGWMLQAPAQVRPNEGFHVKARPNADANLVTLWVDGVAQQSVTWATGRPGEVSFYIHPGALAPGLHHVQLIAAGPSPQATEPWSVTIDANTPSLFTVTGPPIKLGQHDYPPFAVEASNGSSVVGKTGRGYWNANTPTTIRYQRPAELAVLELNYGYDPAAYTATERSRTDGADIVIRFKPDDGPEETLYHRFVNPLVHGMDRGDQQARVAIPGEGPGVITLIFSPGPMGEMAEDWIDLISLNGEYSPLSLEFGDWIIPPETIDAEYGVNLINYRDREVAFAHAPASFVVPQVVALAGISGEFGLLDSAWTGDPQNQSAGAIFSITQLRSDGTETLLLERLMDPVNRPEDRAIQSFNLAVPSAGDARLRYTIRPARPENNGFNHTFWSKLHGWQFRDSIAAPAGPVQSIAANAPNGFALMDEGGSDVTFAHAPSELTFSVPAGLSRLEGAFGLLRRAYRDGGSTDGARFTIEWREPAGASTLVLDRVLHPRDEGADQGDQPFAVKLGSGQGGTLILRTAPAPGGRVDFTWCYWRNLRLDY